MSRPPPRQERSVARLAAVQALYQMELAGAGVEAVAREFHNHRFDRDADGQALAAADEDFFLELIRGVVAARPKIDSVIGTHLKAGWRLERLDATVRAILRCGVLELTGSPATPLEIAIDEYVEITRSFFGAGTEMSFVNALLDSVAKQSG
ncbi:MAG TPA: transcription antitermination factor NusB [Caulobacteraceae bacterium]|jgi:N utilization substance protein B|nr:transcription antitermination factor NusB [Caulobacteraceae bacterium]